MESESVWLGATRRAVKYLMYGFIALTVATAAWMIVAQILDAEASGMFELVRPAGHPVIQLLLVAVAGATLFASLYLSDFIGAIERRPGGFFDFLSLIVARLAMIGIVVTVVVMFFEVVSRYVFVSPTLWANELSLWISGFVFLMAGLYAMQQRSHIRIYIVYDIMPRWMQKSADVISVLLIWAFVIAMIWGDFNNTVDRMMRLETFGTAWDPPIPGTLKPGIIVIIALVAIQALSNLIADWNEAPEHHSPLDDIDEEEIEQIKATLEKDR